MDDSGISQKLGKISVEGNHLILDGKEYRAMGVNVPHLSSGYNGTWPHCSQIYGTKEKMRDSVVDAIKDAAANKMAFIRFFGMPGYPKDKAALYDKDRTEYWKQMDEVLNLCRQNGLRVIPVLGVTGWPQFHELYKEPQQAILDPNSRLHKDVREYVTEFVTRYKDDPVILMWGLSNEAFTKADVDMSRNEKSPEKAKTNDTTLSFDMLLEIYEYWTSYIKSIDPKAIVTSGDSGVRLESVSRREAVSAALKENYWPPKYKFRPDSIKENMANLVESQKSVDVASIHSYIRSPGKDDTPVLAEKIGTIEFQKERLKALRAAGKPVLVGEFAQQNPYLREDSSAKAMLLALDMFEEEGASLICIWVWHFRWQDSDYRAGSTDDRKWNIDSGASQSTLMKRVAEFNARHAGK